MLNIRESDEILVCSTNLGQYWKCKCGFKTITEADNYERITNPNKKLITKIIVTKNFYPMFVKKMHVHWQLSNNIILEK